MSTNNNAGAPADAQQPVFQLQRVYLSGSSLEIPQGSATFLDNSEPRLEFDLDAQAAVLNAANGIFEVSVRCTVTCRLGDKVGFLVEATQAGIFEIRGVSDEQQHLLLGVTCPHIVYPYLRSNIADLIQRASLPPVHLAEINWEAFFQQKMARLAAAQAGTAAEAPATTQ